MGKNKGVSQTNTCSIDIFPMQEFFQDLQLLIWMVEIINYEIIMWAFLVCFSIVYQYQCMSITVWRNLMQHQPKIFWSFNCMLICTCCIWTVMCQYTAQCSLYPYIKKKGATTATSREPKFVLLTLFMQTSWITSLKTWKIAAFISQGSDITMSHVIRFSHERISVSL